MSIFARANQLRLMRVQSFRLENSKLRYLANIWCGAFGHLAQMDYLIKRNILEGRAPEDTVLYIPPGAAVANRFLLDQWRPYLRIVENSKDLPLPEEQMKALEYDFLAPRRLDGTTVQLWEVAADTYKCWHIAGKKPLLKLSPDVIARGRNALERLGIPADAWFVALHVREASSKKHHAALHNILNARIESYLPAMREITQRGGWVIRIGDSTMAPIERSINVIDYCHDPRRSDWMDVFLCAAARFFVGTSSGPAYVPSIYGVPAVLTNWWPLAQRPWHPSDIFIPKLYKRKETLFTLDESLAEPFGHCNCVDYLTQAEGVTVENNEAEDIRLAVIEMLEIVEGGTRYDSNDLAVRARTDEIYARHAAHGMAYLARDFVKRHRYFLDLSTAPGASNGH